MQKQCTKCKKDKVLNEFHKSERGKHGRNSVCKTCVGEYDAVKYWNNREKSIARVIKYNTAHKKEKIQYNAIRYLEHAEEYRERSRVYRSKNKEKEALRQTKYLKENPDIANERAARRRASKINATPSWLSYKDNKVIQAFYTEAVRLTKETGIGHSVDHILPLKGGAISGLHVPWNLQILTDSENSKKHNKFDFTYENKSWVN